MKIQQIAYHRNGVSGNGFHVVSFSEGRGSEKRHFVATVFQEQGNIAVLDLGLLNTNVFDYPNRFRAEDFELEIRAALAKREAGENAENEREIAEMESE